MKRQSLIAGVLAALLILPLVWAEETKKPPQPTVSEESVSSRLENLQRLVRTSSGARRVAASDNSKAQGYQKQADQKLIEAEKLLRKGDYAAANRQLGEATALMFGAIREVGADKEIDQKKRKDFDAKAASVDVLLKALKRIAAEKGAGSESSQTIASVEQGLQQAQQLASEGKLDAARQQLDDVYYQSKVAIEGLRRGDTLVRSLNFATKKDEYTYELDRNDTHKMLVSVLLEEKMKTANTRKMVDDFLAKAAEFRAQAERKAAGGDYKQAVELLESSTKELVRAIRGAGVYIPG
ncbi:hypothetical protein [Sedimenticola hydrogenitrophicus]|uniref:hypothetical protein n=1 Tax=Sedimenticola hydrogenitrophicus TaxID=2967975 RepID=UPI0023AFF8BC|nr:hypothetical protein [Sedimenticola hydrogenitrophicus]